MAQGLLVTVSTHWWLSLGPRASVGLLVVGARSWAPWWSGLSPRATGGSKDSKAAGLLEVASCPHPASCLAGGIWEWYQSGKN